MSRAARLLICGLLGGVVPGAGTAAAGGSGADPIEPARAAVRTKQFARAIALLRAPGNAAQPEARYLLGLALWNGIGVDADRAAAISNLRLAAENGHAAAAYALAAILAEGSAAERDEARHWQQRAIGAGYAPALDARRPGELPLADPRDAKLPRELRIEIARFAARHDDVSLLRAVEPRELVSQRGAFGRTLLAEAADTGAAKTLEALLEAGAAADVADESGVTPLMRVAQSADVRLTQRLLSAGARANAADHVGRTALMRAAAANQPAQVGILLKAGATLNVLDVQGYSATDLAAQAGAGDALQVLRAAGGTVTRAPAGGRGGIDPTRPGALYRGWTPLLVAVSRDDVAEVRRRLAAGDDIGARTPQGAFALRVAVESNAAQAAAALLAAGADPHRKESDGLDARQRVVRFGAPELFEVFFAADVALREPEAQTLLALAVERGDAALLRALLARGADARTAGTRGTSALHLAARRGDAAMIKLLLDHGADPGAADALGRTALWHAAAARSPAALDLLSSAGADAGAADRAGVTPLMLAVRAGDEASLKRLLASEGARDARLLESPLRIAASLGQGALVELLLSHRVAVDAADEFGDTALMAAARAGHGDICQRLLAAGANARLRNRDRTTAADLAEARGFHALAGRLKS